MSQLTFFTAQDSTGALGARPPNPPSFALLGQKLMSIKTPAFFEAGAVEVFTLNLWIQRPLGLRFRRALSVMNRAQHPPTLNCCNSESLYTNRIPLLIRQFVPF